MQYLLIFSLNISYTLSEGFPDSSIGKESAYNAEDPGSIPESGRSHREGIGYSLQFFWASLVAQLVKNLPAMQETWVQSFASVLSIVSISSEFLFLLCFGL